MVRIEIRMLGPLQVRRTDGTAVNDGEWRTAKTLDLLRLLALHNGEAVPVGSVIDKLWPDVDEARGRASLRTAASQLRKVLGEDCVDRRPGGLVLLGAWVDTQAYEALLSDAGASRRSGDHARTVATVEEAEALYVGDLDLPDNPGDWLYEARDHLRRARCRALLDAADAAASLCWMRDSLELAERAAALEMCEEAARALMRALAGVGELEKALSVFDRTRRDLARRYGVDPSPQTRALHLQLLTGTAARNRPVGIVGHEEAVQRLAAALSDVLRQSSQGGVVWLEGEPGSGRDCVTAAACREAGLSLHDVGRDVWLRDPHDVAVSRAEIPASDVVLMPHAESVPPHAIKVLDTLARQHGGVLVVPVAEAPQDSAAEVTRRTVVVERLDESELCDLAELVLQGTPTNRLMRHLRAESGGLSGVACRVARGWLTEGRVVWSVDGLELAESATGRLLGAAGTLRRSLRMMSPFAEDVVNVLALADVEVEADQVAAVVAELHAGASAETVGTALDQLVDAEHVVRGGRGYRLREVNAHPEIVAWMRPRLRQQLHRLVADHVTLSTPHRLALLIAAGEHGRADQLGSTALEQAEASGDIAAAASLRAALARIPAQKRSSAAGDPGRLTPVSQPAPAAVAFAAGAARARLLEPGLRDSPLLESVRPPRQVAARRSVERLS